MSRRQRFLSLFALALGFLCAVRPVGAQADLNGYWDLRIPNTADGTFRNMYFFFEQRGNTLSGKMLRGTEGMPLSGTVVQGVVHFATVPPPPSPPSPGQPARPPFPPLTFEGSFADGKLMLHGKTFFGVLEGTATKVDREVTLPPAPLPLPALHDVPDNGLARTPPMGWNSWNKFAGRVDDAAVRGMADALVTSGMRDAGYLYINIDDTWELNRDANGNIVTNRKFPDMKALADYVHSKGLKIGLYSSPGPQTCAGYLGSFGHETQDAKTYAAWGFDYLKYDLCGDRDVYPEDAHTLQAIYQQMGDALLATHRPIVYSLCEYGDAEVWTGWGTKTGGNLWRTTGDISDTWESMDRIGFSQIKLARFARPGHWNDPDMLEIGNGGMTAEEYRTHMSLWAMLAAPLIAGNDLRSMTAETKSILLNREVIAIDQDPDYKPLQEVASDGKVEILARPLHDGSVVVAMFNRGDTPADASFFRNTLPLQLPAQGTKLRDLWKHEAVAWNGERYKTTVPTHGVVLLRVSAH